MILLDYEAELTTDEEKENFASDYYEKNIERDDAFLYIYFAEEDTDNDVGYMCHAVGAAASEVMDDEAVEIFWSYLNSLWYTDLSTDEMFDEVFSDTADTIMANSKSSFGFVKYVVIAAAVIAAAALIWFLMRGRRSRYDGY